MTMNNAMCTRMESAMADGRDQRASLGNCRDVCNVRPDAFGARGGAGGGGGGVGSGANIWCSKPRACRCSGCPSDDSAKTLGGLCKTRLGLRECQPEIALAAGAERRARHYHHALVE